MKLKLAMYHQGGNSNNFIVKWYRSHHIINMETKRCLCGVEDIYSGNALFSKDWNEKEYGEYSIEDFDIDNFMTFLDFTDDRGKGTCIKCKQSLHKIGELGKLEDEYKNKFKKSVPYSFYSRIKLNNAISSDSIKKQSILI